MKETTAKIKYRREKKSKSSRIDALTDAQKIAFAPFTFQTVACMLELNILQTLDSQNLTKEQIIKECNITEYTFDALFEASKCIGLIKRNPDNTFSNTQLAEAFLFDEMTKVNFNFMKDVCFSGSSELLTSFKESRPAGLQKYFLNSQTIYPLLSKLPEKMKKSWFEFDHHYSDDCFKEVLPVIFRSAFSENTTPKNIFDIGGNTGKFENACLNYSHDCNITMIDLEENIEAAKNNFNTERCHFWSADILKQENNLPVMNGAVFMSQFLDCFSKEQILFILNKISKNCEKNTKIFILEPFIDKQQFRGAAYALTHISLYFTCMANGKSKMYKESDMIDLIEQTDLTICAKYQNIGKYDYTLLECVKK